MSKRSVADVARQLAQAHVKEDPATGAVFLAENDVEVRLVEVSGSIEPTGEILSFRFAARPDRDVPTRPSSCS